METDNITEDYVSFEMAKLLKEKGFNNISSIMYKENGEKCINPKSVVSWRLKFWYPCLTPQMAMKWLRQVYKIDIAIYPYGSENYQFDVYRNRHFIVSKDDGYTTYKKACEAAIQYCLTNLI